MWLVIVKHTQKFLEEQVDIDEEQDPVVKISPLGFNVAPDDLHNFLIEINLRKWVSIILYSERHYELFWKIIQHHPDAIFLLFNEERQWIFGQPRSHGYTVRSVGKWEDRQLCVVHAPVMYHGTNFNLMRFEIGMSQALQYDFQDAE